MTNINLLNICLAQLWKEIRKSIKFFSLFLLEVFFYFIQVKNIEYLGGKGVFSKL
jgi:hypothetical protein